ncbi:MAG: hypothetical protein FJY75_05640, partial [Candidatus Eisenbacteria bacterium]|nr:hypothetical protein [Candidatus Eisenbacteria bacterium]
MPPRRRSASSRLVDRRSRSLALTLALALALVAAWPAPGRCVSTLDVFVVDGQTGAAVAGAFVMIGPWPGTPFPDNHGWTDEGGWIRFTDEALAQPRTATAGAEGYGYTTLCDAALDAVTLPLYPVLPDSTMAGTRARVSGAVQNIATVANDGKFDIALVMQAAPLSDYALQDKLSQITWIEPVVFPVVGTVDMPSHTYMPNQVEYVFFTFSKSPYALDVRGGAARTFYSVSARIPIADLLEGSIANAVAREVGVERAVQVSGPTTLNINSDLDLSQSVTVSLQGVPPGARVQAVSMALIEIDGADHAIGFDTKGDLVVRDASYTLGGRNPSGDLADARNAAVGTFADSSAAASYAVGILDRSAFSVPHSVTFDSWMQVPELVQEQRHFSWSDPTTPGVSPAPTWTRSNLGLRAITPGDASVATTVHWRVYAPAAASAFLLPALPAEAPGPPGGLPDPAATPEADQLYWGLVAANPAGEGQEVIDDFLRQATHWTSRWAPIAAPVADVAGGAPRGARLALSVSPLAAGGPILVRWNRGPQGEGLLELRSPEGRLLRRSPVALAQGSRSWDGRDAAG